MDTPDRLHAMVQRLQDMLVDHATGGVADDEQYQELRRTILSTSLTRDIAPEFLHQCRTLFQFWEFIKHEFRHYAERRQFMWSEFRPMLERLEGPVGAPSDASVDEALQDFSLDVVHDVWSKALLRRDEDPEGAITLARTLLEAVLKHILDDGAIAYDASTELPGLYRLVATELNLAPGQHTEEVFKQILGSCSGVVSGLGSMRNRLSDAHGTGRKPGRPAPRHAELAVNLAGAMAMFLVRTWTARRNAS